MNIPSFNILCVDDDSGFRRYLEHSLGPMYNVEFVDNGTECIHMSKDLLFDVVLVDATLPDMLTEDVVESLKDDPFYKDIPIIVVSYQDNQEARNRLNKCGSDDFLSKVSSPCEVRAMLETALAMAA